MTLIALFISLAIAALGGLGMVFPQKMIAFAHLFESRSGLWAAAVLRIVFGMALYQSAATSHAPDILYPLGIFIVAAGCATPFIGVARTKALIAWWEARGLGFVRAWAGFALALGLLLAGAVVT
jgi:hypothetical protein